MAADVPLWIASLVAAVGLVSPLLIARVSLPRPGGGTGRPSRLFRAPRPAFQPLPA
jgi:hypothetical protein